MDIVMRISISITLSKQRVDQLIYMARHAQTCRLQTDALLDDGQGAHLEKLNGGVRPASQNPYPIYDQNLRYSLPYVWPDPSIKTLFQTRITISSVVQTNAKLR